MDVFAPESLPGVGTGDLGSIAALLGLAGLAVTVGMLLAEGWLGTVVFALAGGALLGTQEEYGLGEEAALAVLVGFGLLALTRGVLDARVREDVAGERALAGRAADDEEAAGVRARAASRLRLARTAAVTGVLVAGMVAGVAWAEWDEVPYRVGDAESWIGLAIGVVFAALGGDVAWRFVTGSVRAGGSPLIVGIALVLAALLLNVAAVYVPFVGGVIVLLAIVAVVRLRRRDRERYKGLRILA